MAENASSARADESSYRPLRSKLKGQPARSVVFTGQLPARQPDRARSGGRHEPRCDPNLLKRALGAAVTGSWRRELRPGADCSVRTRGKCQSSINSSAPAQMGEAAWCASTAVTNDAVVAQPHVGHPYNGMLLDFPALRPAKPTSAARPSSDRGPAWAAARLRQSGGYVWDVRSPGSRRDGTRERSPPAWGQRPAGALNGRPVGIGGRC